MVYLDYSATTPVSFEVLDTINSVTKEFIGNANSLNALGIKSRKLFDSANKQIAEFLCVNESEITYTSSSTESNNIALIGVAMHNFKRGKHILVSRLEHPSIYAICDYLKELGFIIDYVENDQDGLIDLDDLKNKISKETILVSIVSVNSELGIRQHLKEIRKVIKKENPNCIFHSDMTQAVGKVPINLAHVDLATISSHKIYGPKGIALLYKSSYVQINPILFGSGKLNELNPGTIPLPLIVGFAKALRIALTNLEKNQTYIQLLNDKIVKNLKGYQDVKINNTLYSIPHILNISVMNIKPETFIHALDEKEIYVSTNTACSSGNISDGVMAIYDDKLRASHTIRISLSHLTTNADINEFLAAFKEIYERLNSLVTLVRDDK